MTDYDRDECLDMLETIEEQLTALPHKTEEVKDQLQVIAQAKRLRYPIANLYANMWTERGRRARASRELISSLSLNPDLGQGLTPGRDVYRCVDVDPFGTVKLSGTVNEDGVIRVLDACRQSGETIDRDAWMGSHHDYFALLLAHKVEAERSRNGRNRAQLHSTLDDLKDDGVIHGWGQDRLTSRYTVALDEEERRTELSVGDVWTLIGELRPSRA